MAKAKPRTGQQNARRQQRQQPSTLNPPRFKSNGKPGKGPDKSGTKQQGGPRTHKQASQLKPIIPFDVFDKILLVGEGDFSFAASLVTDHGCADVLATAYDGEEPCLEKYPHAQEHLATVRDAFSGPTAEESDADGADPSLSPVMFGVDATSLHKHKPLRRRGPFHRIFFNFPHTGGLSTDVNRQVRANQALLSGFFKSAAQILVDGSKEQSGRRGEDEHHTERDADQLAARSSVIVTVFEGEPYTLWNVRDLARNADLVVLRSFAFQASVYPSYRHARTCGIVKKDSGAGEVSETAWKGETRPARTYEFGLKTGQTEAPKRKKKKNGQEESSSDED